MAKVSEAWRLCARIGATCRVSTHTFVVGILVAPFCRGEITYLAVERGNCAGGGVEIDVTSCGEDGCPSQQPLINQVSQKPSLNRRRRTAFLNQVSQPNIYIIPRR